MKTDCRIEVKKHFDLDGNLTGWSVVLTVWPLPNESIALDFAQGIAKGVNRHLPLDKPFEDLHRVQ